MRICAISDLHGNLIETPDSDLLLIAGDIISHKYQYNFDRCLKWLENDFKQWCKDQETWEIVLIAGSHDLVIERRNEKVKQIFKEYGEWFHYLENETKTLNIEGQSITIFGTPYTRKVNNWAFMLGNSKLWKYYAECPDNVDIILSHDGAYNTSDICYGLPNMYKPLGNEYLRKLISLTNYKWFIHGSLHTASHKPVNYGTGKTVCASLVNENYKLNYKPFLFDYE